jgi:HEAT repeat protein
MINAQVGEMERTRDIPGLIAALKHHEESVRQESAEALGRIGDEQAIEALITALDDPYSFDPAVVYRGDRSWEEMGSEEMVYPVRKAAGEALDRILKKKRSPRPDINGLVARNDVEGLIAALDYERNDDSLRPWRQVEKLSLQNVLAIVDVDSGWVRYFAAEALNKLEDRRAAEAMLKALEDHDPRIRKEAIYAIGKFHERRAVEPLLRILGEENERLAEIAVWALGEIGDERAVEPLIAKLLHDKSWSMRDRAALALGSIGDNRAAPALADRSRMDENEVVRSRATRALQLIELYPKNKITDDRKTSPTPVLQPVMPDLESPIPDKNTITGDHVIHSIPITQPAAPNSELPIPHAAVPFQVGDIVEQYRHFTEETGFVDGPGYGMADTKWKVVKIDEDEIVLELVEGILNYTYFRQTPGYVDRVGSSEYFREKYPGCKGNQRAFGMYRKVG